MPRQGVSKADIENLLRKGLTQKEIGRELGVSQAAISQAINRFGMAEDTRRSERRDYIPWVVSSADQKELVMTALLGYARSEMGMKTTEMQRNTWDRLRTWLEKRDVVVGYDEGDGGWFVAKRTKGDAQYTTRRTRAEAAA